MTTTICPRCGPVSTTSAKFCERCGASLAGGEPDNSRTTSSSTNYSTTRPLEPARSNVPSFSFGGNVAPRYEGWKPIAAVILIVLVLGTVGWGLYKWGAEWRRASIARAKRNTPPTLDERTRKTMLSYLASPGFAGTKVAQQVLGPVRLELWQLNDREVYFSAPAPEQTGETFETMIARFVIDPKRVVLAEDKGQERLRIGTYSLRKSADKHFFFKTPVDNIKFDPATVLKFPFKTATYTVDMSELADFLQNKSVFGGQMHALTDQTRDGQEVIFANHGALVARPGETSLRRFVDELTRDIPAESAGAREARVQRVLDLVSSEIAYDARETTYDFELLKRPNEVLMSGESDCSNKAILLGSLLEQLGEDYLFIYTPDHITVAVRQGGFPARNGLSLEWDGQTWLIAESTVPGFRIGVDRVSEEARLKQFQHVQRPRERDLIYDLATGRLLTFQ